MKFTRVVLFFLSLVFNGIWSHSAPSDSDKVQLEDVNIKGEVNKDNMNFAGRNKMNLDDRVTIRKQFRDRILENLPTYYKKTEEKVQTR